MNQITVVLPDANLKSFLEQVVASGKFGSADEYIVALIKEDRERRRKARLEALLLEGLEGEPTPLTDEDWQDMHRRYD